MQPHTIPHGHWQLDKTVNMTHIISTVTVIISLFVWGGTIDKRIDQNNQNIQHITELIALEKNRVNEITDDMKNDIRSLDDKTDRLIRP
ncbi:hypothetical protein [Zooshikella harenae]|uniref:Uncharacterized protein n=1 Tax=Zooshikella harenae TaxID=2827238 RepID=A0ABS5ZG40_9GAMM|nr:hypothetical protein [Zooshikella harenae]MBU2711942.1 hypothetical protein [Zooshikella harenae]